MFCPKCGNQVADGAAFCASCGTKLEVQAAPQPAYEAVREPVQQPAYTQQPVFVAPVQQQAAPVVAPERPQEDPELNSLATNTMIFGIIGLALSEMGIPGIILSNIAMNKASEFERKAGKLFGKALVGRRLAKPGKIVGIIMTIFWAVYFLVAVIAGIASAL